MFDINRNSTEPLHNQLIHSVKTRMMTGTLQAGDRLPSIRELANQLMINPNIVTRAYQELEKEKLIITVHGSGTFIKKIERKQTTNPQVATKMKEQLDALLTEAFFENIEEITLINWVHQHYEAMKEVDYED